MTLQELLSLKVKAPNGQEYSPDFVVSVQGDPATMLYPRIIIHAAGHDSDTLDFYVCGNELVPLLPTGPRSA